LIKPNEPIILFPMAYSHMRSTHTGCYGSDDDCKPFGLPLQGNYDDYGSMTVAPSSESVASTWLASINASLKNNPDNITQGWRNITPRELYIFKCENHNQPEHGGFISDANALKKATAREGLYEKTALESVSEVLSVLYDGALLDICSHQVNRMGFLLIKQSIFDALIADFYVDLPAKIKQKVSDYYQQALVAKAHVDTLDPQVVDRKILRKADKAAEINEHTLSYEVLELFNDDMSLVRDLVKILEDGIEALTPLVEMSAIIEHTVRWSLLMRIYRDNGKSLFPNVNRIGNMAPVDALNRVVSQAIRTTRDSNISNVRSDNSYDELSPEEQKEVDDDLRSDQWTDHRSW
jgi:hypothetical protein